MKLAETHYDNTETGCCARVDTGKWDEKVHTWHEKPFLRDHIRAFLHMPLNFGSVISRDHALVEEAGAYPADPIWLTDEVSPWGSDVYLAIDRPELAGAKVETLSGTFMTKVFEGPFRDAGKWADAMERYVVSRGAKLKKLYFFYATCPECAKRFGRNQVVLFAQVNGLPSVKL
jgi:hypothetical protein